VVFIPFFFFASLFAYILKLIYYGGILARWNFLSISSFEPKFSLDESIPTCVFITGKIKPVFVYS
jgi:hypothetical protein